MTGLKLGQYPRTKGKPYRFGTDEFVSPNDSNSLSSTPSLWINSPKRGDPRGNNRRLTNSTRRVCDARHNRGGEEMRGGRSRREGRRLSLESERDSWRIKFVFLETRGGERKTKPSWDVSISLPPSLPHAIRSNSFEHVGLIEDSSSARLFVQLVCIYPTIRAMRDIISYYTDTHNFCKLIDAEGKSYPGYFRGERICLKKKEKRKKQNLLRNFLSREEEISTRR